MRWDLRGYATAVGAVGIATALGLAMKGTFDPTEIAMVYILAIVVAALRARRGPAIAAALLAVLAFDFLFVPPRFTLVVDEAKHLVTFAVMLIVALVTSTLAARRVALALEGARLAEEARRAQLDAESERLRSALLGAVSHDLRTPLTAITGSASTLLDGEAVLADEERRELLGAIRSEAERLARRVGHALDMARLESGALTPRPEWQSVEELVASALDRLGTVLAGRAATARIPPELPLVRVDAVLIEEVLVNLLENAAKHTPAGTPIDVSARAEEGGVLVEVADRGPGIAAAQRERLFEKFYRGATAAAGTGLGLAIARGFVEAHGGRVGCRPRDGGGAVFHVWLPVPESPPVLADDTAPAERTP